MEEKLENILDDIQKTLETAQESLLESTALLTQAVREDDYFEICNLMGRYASYHYYGEHEITYDFFALDDPRTTAELGSTGIYQGRTKIFQMFDVYHIYNNQPGTAHMHPLNSPYIHVAGDGKSAKGVWLSNGLEVLPPPPGRPPLSMWFLDGYYMEFVKTQDGWKWLHFHMLDDIKAVFDISWSEQGKERNPGPGGLIEPSYKTDSYEPYWRDRGPSLEIDALPGPYESLQEE